MWHLVNVVIKKKSSSALHHSPGEYAQDLVETWSAQPQSRNLSEHFQEAEDKSRIFSPRNLGTLPEFSVGDCVIPPCMQYVYLGAPVRITPAIPVRRVHPIVRDLMDRLQQRLTPLMWLKNNAVTFTHTSKKDLPLLQKQLALETIATFSSSVPAVHHLYTDGFPQADGSAGCTLFSPDVDPPAEGWVGCKLPNWSISTYSDLQGLLEAVDLLLQRRLNGVIVCDSQSALQALFSPKPLCLPLIQHMLSLIALAHDNSLVIHFWNSKQ
ncbi:hypothetical protein Hamer_G003612 [Homarus americanus]|uniref:Uncharacterized protein n=1 Tax=Homarus americanus TaxID=6706 RepID=A0A8J5K0P6_HOMAM|nr:hypothetical protein Hamer_G003612 [Homarus americanus]